VSIFPSGVSVPNQPPPGAWVNRGRGDIYDDSTILSRFIDRFRPDEGFLSVALVLALAGIVGWSIADARWILGRDGLTSFLIWMGLGGAFWGYASAQLRIAPWQAQALGCVVGAFVILEAVGSVLPGAKPGLDGWFSAAATSIVKAYLDLSWRHQLSTVEYGHFCLLLGILVWGTAQAASYDVFGYHRTVNAVLLLAVGLIGNMALTTHDQYQALVIFSVAALALLLVAHAADERSGWLAHRIWKGSDFRAPHIEGGAAFAAIAICAALVLTTVASSAPLAGPLRDWGQNVADAAGWLTGYLPAGGQTRIQPSADYGSVSTVGSSFQAGNGLVFQVRVPDTNDAFHWRLVTYDRFETNGWSIGTSTQDAVIAGTTINDGTLDLVTAVTPGRTLATYTVHVQDGSLKHLIAANEPDHVDVTVTRQWVGTGLGDRDVVGLSTNATDYTVSAFIPEIDPAGAGLTEWRLAHAGNNYPVGLLSRYTQGASFLGPDAHALVDEIRTWAISQGNTFDNEYLVAKAMQAYLQSSRFTYKTDISTEMAQCAGLSTADCFAKVRVGFCEQYATTMTMLMRSLGYPARYALGYLPGNLDKATLTQQVTSQQKHAWVEVFFPGYGWIPFDPTGGSVGKPTVLPAGDAVPSQPATSASPATPEASGSQDANGPVTEPDEGSSVAPASSNGSPLLLVFGGLAAAGLLAAFLWFRRPRRTVPAEAAYGSLVRFASRLGYRPRPAQTVLEYTGMLADVVPDARDPLDVVARATVEVTYGRKQLGGARLAAVSEAHSLIRRSLLRLALSLSYLRRFVGGSRGNSPRR
jgi:transglutaminase-like putative cysteine protease